MSTAEWIVTGLAAAMFCCIVALGIGFNHHFNERARDRRFWNNEATERDKRIRARQNARRAA